MAESGDLLVLPAPRGCSEAWPVWVGRALIPLLARVEVTGAEHFPPGGPLLVVGNHVAAVEVALMVAYAPWQIELLGPGDIPTQGALGAISRFYGYTPIRRGRPDRGALGAGAGGAGPGRGGGPLSRGRRVGDRAESGQAGRGLAQRARAGADSAHRLWRRRGGAPGHAPPAKAKAVRERGAALSCRALRGRAVAQGTLPGEGGAGHGGCRCA